MKVISIGRNPSSDICIEDPRVSRRHAAIRIRPFGRIEIIDYSRNGTTVNSRRIKPESFYPIKRGDEIIFADSVSLDWSLIPRPKGLVVCLVSIVLVLLLCGVSLIYPLRTDRTDAENIGETLPLQVDTSDVSGPDITSPAETSPDGTDIRKPGTENFLKRLLEKEKMKQQKRHIDSHQGTNRSRQAVEAAEVPQEPSEESAPEGQINPYL